MSDAKQMSLFPAKREIVPVKKTAQSLGGEWTLTDKDLSDLKAGTLRVADLMKDGGWYSPDQIRRAAGKNGAPATEGLRRLRELRSIDGVEIEKRRRQNTRCWEYRVTIDASP